MSTPLSMQDEAERAISVAKAVDPSAAFWRGDVLEVENDGRGRLSPGVNFNVVDDSNYNVHELFGQFRVLTMTAAPEGYMAIVAVQSTAVANQIPNVLMSKVIRSTMVHQI